MPDEPTLTRVHANFYTQDEDKDEKTFLECWINMRGEREAAYASVDHVGFPDNNPNPVDLLPKTNVMRKRDVPGSWFQVRIHPDGNDTWRFHCDVELHFSDGSKCSQAFPETTDINQDVNQANFKLDHPIWQEHG